MNKVQKIREEVERIQLYTQSEVLKQVLDYIDKVQEEPVSEDLIDAANNALERMLDKYGLVGTGSCLEMFKLGAKWQKAQENPVSNDLEAEIDYLSKRYPEVSFAKLTRIAVHVAKWMMKDAVEETVDIDSNGLACVNVNDDDIMIGDTVKVLIKKGGKQ